MDNFIAHILVVDDDEGIRTLVKKYLNENNYLVTTATIMINIILPFFLPPSSICSSSSAMSNPS